ncbi:hypothetical protein H9M94_00085 [Mycoplasma sp. Pen4]|uniref:hypothetical protein n=1 Tax=Mycoplasma sp. Pen4 TaxID=640330 RepID=UPI001654BEDF|nr:hypothetical protein [Mycoplasma sp. Pen4]QNM93665.1 hypothetical protein H9M94_00085 [Mycoplasma sp. Pen4]
MAIIIPIWIGIAIFIAFLFGYFGKYKWAIGRLIVLILTIIGAVITASTLSENLADTIRDYVKKHFGDDFTFINQFYEQAIPFATTLITLLIYIGLKIIFYIVMFIISLIKRNKNKQKKKKRLRRIFFAGLPSAIISIPSTLFWGNILSVSEPANTTISYVTNEFGTKIITGGKGANMAGVNLAVQGASDIANSSSEVGKILSKKAKDMTPEDFEKLTKAVTSITQSLANKDVRKLALTGLKSQLIDNTKINSALSKDTIDNWINETEKKLNEDPKYSSLTKEEKQNEFTKEFATTASKTFEELLNKDNKDSSNENSALLVTVKTFIDNLDTDVIDDVTDTVTDLFKQKLEEYKINYDELPLNAKEAFANVVDYIGKIKLPNQNTKENGG